MSVILVSASKGATKEAVEEALTKNGMELPAKEAPEPPAEPKRDDFETDEEFEQDLRAVLMMDEQRRKAE